MEEIHIADRGKGWLCIEKPTGISVHNEVGKDIISILETQLFPRDTPKKPLLQPVHRLDKETSGLLLLATKSEVLAWVLTGICIASLR